MEEQIKDKQLISSHESMAIHFKSWNKRLKNRNPYQVMEENKIIEIRGEFSSLDML